MRITPRKRLVRAKPALPAAWWTERSDSSDTDLIVKALNKAYPQRDYLSGGQSLRQDSQ